jgi:multidrug resistance efflux pump
MESPVSMPEETLRARQPALRTDLIVSRQAAPEGTVYVIKLPESGRFFRLKEAEHFIALQLDGTTPLQEIRHRAAARFGWDVSPAVLEQFVARLRLIGLLQDSPGTATPRPARRVRGDPFYLRFKIADPDRLLGWLSPRLGFLYTPWFLLGSAGLIVAAMAISLGQRAEIARDVASLFRLDILLFAWVTVLSVSTLHEMAHGLTCKRFGGEVHEIGFLVIYLQPALYCNVSDAWLFPEKAKRLWVTFSGAYFEIVIWAISTFVWRLAERGTGLSEAALVVMATSGIKTLFNWNPLIKLDGYYLLSDALEIPNLRWKAIAYLKGLFSLGSGPGPLATVQGATAGNARTVAGAQGASGRRECRILLVYGVLASAYSVWLIGMIATHIGGYLVGRYQGAGAIGFAVVMGSFFRGSLKKAFVSLERLAGLSQPMARPLSPRPAAPLRPAPQPESSTPAGPTSPTRGEDAGDDSPGGNTGAPSGGPARLRHSRARLRQGWTRARSAAGRLGPRKRLAIGAAALLALLAAGRMELKVAGEFRVLPSSNADVRAGVVGLIEEVLVDEGDRVRAGDLLARISDRDLRAGLSQIEAEIDHKAAILRMLEMGPRPEEIELARKEGAKARTERDHAARQLAEGRRIQVEDLARQKAAVAKAEGELASSRKNLERVQALAGSGLIARQEVEDAAQRVAVRQNELAEEQAKLRMVQADDLAGDRKDLAVAEKEVEAGAARLRILHAGSRPEELEAQRADIAALESKRSHLEEQIRLTRVIAPHAGVIVTPRLKEKVGSKVESGELIAEVHALEKLTAEIAVPEMEIGTVHPGQPVVLKSRAFPERALHGRVTAVAPAVQAEEGGWGRTFVRVKAEIEAPGAPLRSEMTGQAKILCGKRSIFDLLTRRLTRYLRVEFWSWW